MRMETEVLIPLVQHSIFAAAYNICRNVQDAEDVVQDTFLQYHTGKQEFETEEHIRAWLLRVADERMS